MRPIPPDQRFDRPRELEGCEESAVEVAFRFLAPGRDIARITRLEGGYSNANHKVTCGDGRTPEHLVVRVCRGTDEEARREASVLELAAARGLPVPTVLARGACGPRPAALVEWVPGRLLAEVLASGGGGTADVLTRVGRVLGRVHGTTFDSAGMFGPDGSLAQPFDDFAAATLELMLRLLAGRAGRRLGREIRLDLQRLASTHWQAVADTDPQPVLVHGDFNPKNVMIRPDGLPVILDWEFAMAGHPMIDVGNFLRFREDYDDEGIAAFLAGYAVERGRLTPSRRRAARMLDLIAMVQFLSVEDERPRTFGTAREIIRRTLAMDEG